MWCPRLDSCNGYLDIDYDSKFWKLKFHRCNHCSVLVLPYIYRYISFHFYRHWGISRAKSGIDTFWFNIKMGRVLFGNLKGYCREYKKRQTWIDKFFINVSKKIFKGEIDDLA